MWIAIEAFLDSQGRSFLREHQTIRQRVTGVDHDRAFILRDFGEYVDALGTQPVTITMSSLVNDMLESYAEILRGLDGGGFSWRSNLEQLVLEFTYTRECFFFSANRAPFLEATFRIMRYHERVLDVAIDYTWSPPLLEFADLSNVVSEDCEFRLEPIYPSRPRDGVLCTTAEYFVGPGEGWLRWDEAEECFRGIVPRDIASCIGAERFEAYTVPLELTARITKHFPGCMRFERIVRCTLPLTVKRSPSRCKSVETPATSPPLPQPESTGRIKPLLKQKIIDGARTQCVSTPLTFPPLLRSPGRRSHAGHQSCSPWRSSRTCMTDVAGKENAHIKPGPLMERKTASSRPESPLRLNSLTLARLHDAVALANPPASLTDIEVRTMYHAGCDSATSDAETENAQRSTLAQDLRNLSLRSGQRAEAPVLPKTICESARVKGHHKLQSKSVSREEAEGSQGGSIRDCVDRIFKNATEEDNKLFRAALRDLFAIGSFERSHLEPSAPPHSRCSMGIEHDGTTVAKSTQENEEKERRAAERRANEWQAAIQQNFREFQSKGQDEKDEKDDRVLEHCVDSEEELPSFQSDL